jgi:hypothetical protein
MTHEELIELLLSNNFETGWVLSEGKLVVWEHDQDPPSPLKRPTDE